MNYILIFKTKMEKERKLVFIRTFYYSQKFVYFYAYLLKTYFLSFHLSFFHRICLFEYNFFSLSFKLPQSIFGKYKLILTSFLV